MKNLIKILLFMFVLLFAFTVSAFPFGKDFTIQDSDHTISENKPGTCRILWSLEVKNNTEKDLQFYPNVQVERDREETSRTTIIRGDIFTLDGNETEKTGGLNKIEDCSKENIEDITISGRTFEKEEK